MKETFSDVEDREGLKYFSLKFEKNREKVAEAVFEEIMAENFSNLLERYQSIDSRIPMSYKMG